MWRDHIEFFVAYTTALAKKDKAGQTRRSRPEGYIGPRRLPRRRDGTPAGRAPDAITEHVRQLKGQIDAYAAGDYEQAYMLPREATAHMWMTGHARRGDRGAGSGLVLPLPEVGGPGAPGPPTFRARIVRFRASSQTLNGCAPEAPAQDSQAPPPRPPGGPGAALLDRVHVRVRDRAGRRDPEARPALPGRGRAGRLHLRERRQDRARRSAGRREPRAARAGRDRPADEARDRRDRGPAVQRARRRRPPRDPARRLGGHHEQERRAGWLDDHAAVREERDRQGRPHDQPQGEGGGARVAARAALGQGPDPHRVPEHDLLRERRVRRPAGRAHVLRPRRSRADAARGGAARRDPEGSVAATTPSRTRARPAHGAT